MKVILCLTWSIEQNPVVLKAQPIELNDKGADFLLDRSAQNKYPSHILPENAAEYGLDVTVEEVQPEGKVSRKGNTKTEPVIEPETFEDPFKLADEEIPVLFTEPETEPKPKKSKKPVVKSKADLEAGK